MACAPVLDGAAIPERLVAVDQGQPSWGRARKLVNRPIPIGRARHEQFTSYPHSVPNIRRSSVHTGSFADSALATPLIVVDSGDNKSGVPPGTPEGPEPRPTDSDCRDISSLWEWTGYLT